MAALAVACGGSVAVVHCGGLEPPPPHYPVPSPSGTVGVFKCVSPKPLLPTQLRAPVPFDDAASWTHREGVFDHLAPIRETSLPAGDLEVRWKPAQSLLWRGEEKHALVPIGGDYWRETKYFLAPRSATPWVSSGFEVRPGEGLRPRQDGDRLKGAMTSKEFLLGAKFLRVALGGNKIDNGADRGDLGVELLVKPGARTLAGCSARPVSAEPPSGFVVVRVLRPLRDAGQVLEPLEWAEVPLAAEGCNFEGLTGAVRVVDASAGGHINVGAIQLADTSLASAPGEAAPLWGFADFHAHPFDHLGFGGLSGVRTIWGVPGGSMSEYVGDPAAVRASMSRDVPPCDEHLTLGQGAHRRGNDFNAHHGGYTAPTVINAAEGRVAASIGDLSIPKIADQHPSQGAPTFKDFPDFRRGAHEQHHITQIHRAYLGGLRLMSALAVHNPALEYAAGWVRCGDEGRPTVDVSDDMDVVRAHVQAMRQLAQLNRDWMEIAYTPRQARDIIAHNKLAVILGIEVPRLGADADVEGLAGRLEGLGIRQVIVVHGLDNQLAGSALFQDLYNSATDWANRRPQDRDKVETLSGTLTWTQFPASFFEITTSPSPLMRSPIAGEAPEPTEAIEYRLATPQRAVLSDVFPRPGQFTYTIPFVNMPFGVLHTLVNTTPLFTTQEGPYDQFVGGHRNVRGLSGRGDEFIERLMQRGMLVDVAHMSDQTLADVFAMRACPDYPLMVSHAHFRALAMKVDYSDRAADFVARTSGFVGADLERDANPMAACIEDHHRCDPRVCAEAERTVLQAPQLGAGTVNRQYLPREFDIASSELQQIRVRGGAIGAFLGQGAIESAAFVPERDLPGGLKNLPFKSDCAGTSKDLALALLFGAARTHGQAALGVASDFTLVGSVSPRFGENACAGYLGAGSGLSSGAQLLETMLDAAHYKLGDQKDAVVYSGGTQTCSPASKGGVQCGNNVPLDPYVMGDRTYDVNVDGLAHYGLVPDLLQDVANVLHDDDRHDVRGLALDPLFQSASRAIEMWERARALSDCEHRHLCIEPTFSDDPMCLGGKGPRAACGDACPCSWNRGAPLQEVAESYDTCDAKSAIALPAADARGKPTTAPLVYSQHRADPLTAADSLTEQGDWAIYSIRSPQQTWSCGGGSARLLKCPPSANYVKIRRALDTTVSPTTERCDYQPLPPEAGNRFVVFQCLEGPPYEGPAGGAR